MKSKSTNEQAGPNKKVVGIWIRVSTEDQVRGESPAVHEKRARLYAEAKGWDVRELYHLEAVSGKSVMGHPEAQRMLKDIRSGKITGLIFSKLARLARNTRELLEFSEEFRKVNVDLISLQEAIDTSSPAGRLFYTMIAAMAQWEREEIASRVAASVPIRAKMGKLLGGKAPFGYERKDGKLVPNSTEAPVLKLIFELFLENRRKKAVARILTERGYRTSKGCEFSNATIKRILSDPVYKGFHRVNYSRVDPDTRRIVLKPKEDWVLQEVEPLVSEETWTRANSILSQTKARPNARKVVHLFAGVVFCRCGDKMYVPSRNPRYVCWDCKNRIPVTDLEAIYHEQLKGFLFSEEHLAKYLSQTDSLLSEKEQRVGHLEAERQSLKAEMDKTYRLYQENQITPQGFGSRYKPLEERLAQVEEQLPAEQAAYDVLRINRLSHDEILREARDLHLRWPTLGKEEKRAIVEAITERIVVGKDEVSIQLHYMPESPTAGPGVPDPSAIPKSCDPSRNDAKKVTYPNL